MNLSPPSSQKAGDRPISFLLDDQALGSSPTSVDLVIRPEDLTRVDPSRISVQQTLGSSVWADNFGPGLPTINISGHTGWRRTMSEADDGDGLARFQHLNDTVFKEWHKKRRLAAEAGFDPDLVKLVFTDLLDGFACVVAPMSFTLRRSRSRPLLAQYQIALTVTNQDVALPYAFDGAVSGALGYLIRAKNQDWGDLEFLGLQSLTASVSRITDSIKSVQSFVTKKLVAPVSAFMTQTARLYGQVRSAISAGSAIAGSLISVAQMTARAGVNLFRTLAAVASIPQLAKAQLMSVAGAYSNIFCVLRNALRQKMIFQDYSDLYGASNCSSTAGGRPISKLANQNPFYATVPTPSPLPVSATASARDNLKVLADSDPVTTPISTTRLVPVVTAIANGFSVKAV